MAKGLDQFLADLAIEIVQINPTVGDVPGNCALVERYTRASSAELCVFSELVITGYPPEDLVYRSAFVRDVREHVTDLARQLANVDRGVLISAPWLGEDGQLYNAALLLHDGQIQDVRYKRELPNYGVFDEKRVFAAGDLPAPIDFKDRKLGVMVCEDMWFADVSASLAQQGAEILISLNASPYEMGKGAERTEKAQQRVSETGLPLIYVNQVGGQDEIVFDGRSFILDETGALVQQLAPYEEVSALVAIDKGVGSVEDENTLLYQALVVALRDYVNKNGFPGVILGLSGGVDSAISAAIAVDAIGADRVRCVMLPSRYTSGESLDDAEQLADALGLKLENIVIGDIVDSFEAVLPTDAPSIMFENLQSRSRGVILMALSNASGHMVLSTGNKSEMAVGYATIYGDMCGGYNALKDVYKTKVYELCSWLNETRGREIIPANIITKAPTAELRENQTDQDSLPEYEVLDTILHGLIEGEKSTAAIVTEHGYDAAEVKRVCQLLMRAEYKRRQSAPGVKVSSMAFGKERRYPITNRYTEKL